MFDAISVEILLNIVVNIGWFFLISSHGAFVGVKVVKIQRKKKSHRFQKISLTTNCSLQLYQRNSRVRKSLKNLCRDNRFENRFEC